MSKGDTFEADILKLIFNGTAISNLADNAATAPITFIFVGLHTADPGETGTGATNEATYTGYTRVAVARTSGGWTISGTAPAQAAPVATISFPAATGGTNTITHFSVAMPQQSTVTVTSATPGVVSWTSHGLPANTPVVFTSTSAVPTGLTANTVYYVTSANLLTNSFTVSATPGGAAIATSSTGSGTITAFAGAGTGKLLYSGTVTPNLSVVNGVTPQLTTASTVTED